MDIRVIYSNYKGRLVPVILGSLINQFRILKYKMLSECVRIHGNPIYSCPAQINGLGVVKFNGKVQLGVKLSPFFFNSYIYIEARNKNSIISIDKGTFINNNACLIAEGEGIFIAENVLIGPNFSAFDSDFHDLNPLKRLAGSQKTLRITISKNVFIGSNVTILKGVEIGENSVIGSQSVVVKSIPPNVIAGGNPCKVLKPFIVTT